MEDYLAKKLVPQKNRNVSIWALAKRLHVTCRLNGCTHPFNPPGSIDWHVQIGKQANAMGYVAGAQIVGAKLLSDFSS